MRDLSRDWRALSVQQLVSVTTTPEDRVILATDQQIPLLTERTVGDGRLLVFTSALDPLWNNLPLEPLFVPFIIRSIEYLRGESAAAKRLSLGDSISVAPGAQLVNSDGNSLRDLSDLTRRGSFTFTEPGVYTVRSAAGNSYLSVNTDPRESELGSLELSQIERWRALGSGDNTNNAAAVEVDSPVSTRQSLWYWILLCLLAVALIESLCSHRHLWVKRGA